MLRGSLQPAPLRFLCMRKPIIRRRLLRLSFGPYPMYSTWKSGSLSKELKRGEKEMNRFIKVEWERASRSSVGKISASLAQKSGIGRPIDNSASFLRGPKGARSCEAPHLTSDMLDEACLPLRFPAMHRRAAGSRRPGARDLVACRMGMALQRRYGTLVRAQHRSTALVTLDGRCDKRLFVLYSCVRSSRDGSDRVAAAVRCVLF